MLHKHFYLVTKKVKTPMESKLASLSREKLWNPQQSPSVFDRGASPPLCECLMGRRYSLHPPPSSFLFLLSCFFPFWFSTLVVAYCSTTLCTTINQPQHLPPSTTSPKQLRRPISSTLLLLLLGFARGLDQVFFFSKSNLLSLVDPADKHAHPPSSAAPQLPVAASRSSIRLPRADW